MDLFAAILVTITAITICGICLFIFVCAFQPWFLRKLHGKTIRTYQDTDSNVSPNDDDLSIKNLDLLIDSTAPTTENPSTSLQANGRDRKAYLKSLEQSLRTGRRIQNDNNAPEEESHSNPFNFISHCINKHIHQKTTDTHTTTEL